MNIGVADFIQAQRTLRIESALGADALLVERMRLREEISGLFELELSARSKTRDIAPDQLVGTLADVSLDLGAGERRTWNGLVTELFAGPNVTRELQSYRLVLRPDLWLLGQRSDCRIWMDRTSLEVAETLLSEHGVAPPNTAGVTEPPPPQHYSVQYNETDLAYLTRRLEEDGLFYWFEHEPGRHQVRIASHQVGYTTGDEPDVRYAGGSTDQNHISRFETRFLYTPGRRAGRDWNFETPGEVPGAATPSMVTLPRNERYELYEYPARALHDRTVGRQETLRMQAVEADHQRIEGASTARMLAPGRRFTPYDVANPDNVFEEHVILAIEHEALDLSYETGPGQPELSSRASNHQSANRSAAAGSGATRTEETGTEQPEYANRFLALPSRVPATPHRATSRPRIDGAQVAIVAGLEGEEINPDQYGRIKVWFPWDRRARRDGSDTCWIRVMQGWAGPGWGEQVIPRIGMEVMITYLEGDPDRPVVAGVVPNARQRVPYPLPEHKTKSVFRSDTHKGPGFNEVTFEDERGQENMFFHAQKDQTTRVLNDRVKRIDRHEVSAVGENRTVEVGRNQKHEVGGSMNTVVGGTGVSALALMTAVGGLAGHTAGLLQQAGAVAGGGGAALSAFAGTLASSALGFFGAGGLTGRSGVVSGPNPGRDAGRHLGDSGSTVGEAASGLFPMPGVMNTIVGSFRSESVGIASVEQVGMAKVTNVGATFLENVGTFRKTTVGDEFVIEVGRSRLVMRQDGTVIITGTNFNFTASGPVQINGSVVDLNRPGGAS